MSRIVAICLSLFGLANSIAGMFRRELDANTWWVDLCKYQNTRRRIVLPSGIVEWTEENKCAVCSGVSGACTTAEASSMAGRANAPIIRCFSTARCNQS